MSRSRVRLHADVDKYTSLRVTELRQELRDRGLDSKGRKAELVKRLGRGELNPADLPQVLAKEVAVGMLLATGLAIGAYPRVRLLSSHATDLDALADPER